MNHTIIFIRHGESLSNKVIHDNHDYRQSREKSAYVEAEIKKHTDPVLTEKGEVQSRMTAEYLTKLLKRFNVNPSSVKIYSSPFKRTIQTAMPLVESLNMPLIIDEQLFEYTRPSRKAPNGHCDESFDDFKARVHVFMSDLKEIVKKDPRPIVVYGHSLFISYMLSAVNRDLDDMKHFTTQHFTFKVPNCSINTLMYRADKDVWTVCNVSSIGHLNDAYTGVVAPTGIAL